MAAQRRQADDDPTEPHGWEPADLQAILDGNAQVPTPSLLRRSDGVCLLYPGKLHTLHGEAESGKSWAVLLAVKQEVETGHCAVYVDFEDCAQTLLTRLRHLGLDRLDRAVIVEHLTYITPTDPLGDRALAWLHALLTERQPSLVVLDGVTEAMHLHGLDPLGNVDFAEFRQRLLRPLQDAGAAVVQIDHVVKHKNARGRYAFGGQHKLAAIDGAAFTFDIIKSFAPDADGVVTLKVAKDRHGEVRRHAPGGSEIAELRMSADGRLTLAPPSGHTKEDKFRPTVLMEKVSKALEGEPGPLSQNAIEQRVSGKAQYVRLAVKCLHEEGFIERRGWEGYVSARPFRKEDEHDTAA